MTIMQRDYEVWSVEWTATMTDVTSDLDVVGSDSPTTNTISVLSNNRLTQTFGLCLKR